MEYKNFRFNDKATWYGFGIFLLLLALSMGLSIYFKERSVAPGVSVIHVVLWQMAVWLPLIFVISSITLLLRNARNFSKNTQKLYLVAGICVLILCHYGWFFLISSTISPYLGIPKTKFGVFPFFFIAWVTLDFVVVSALLAYALVLNTRNNTTPSKLPDTVVLKKGNKHFLLKPEEIYWIGAENYYISIHTEQGIFLERRSLKAFLELLPNSQFLRIHRSTVVNVLAIRTLISSTGKKLEVQLLDGNTRTVSRPYIRTLKEVLSGATLPL